MDTLIENRKLRGCLWIVNMLQKYGRLKLSELSQYWLEDTDISRGVMLGRRTFFNYRLAIQDMLGIVIECDKPTNTYYIKMQDDNALSNWLVSSFNVGQLVTDRQEVRNRILLDAPPSGMEHFSTIVESFRRNCCLRVTYQKFDGMEPYDCHLQPYCLRIHQHRLYLLAVKNHGTHPVTFALDRMKQVELLRDDAFAPADGFSAQEYYRNSYGIWTQEGEVPELRLRAYGNERNYLRTLPLHASQREVMATADYSDFVLTCYPTRDLLLHLLSHGQGLEVLAPDSLRQEMAQEVRSMMERYG